MAFSHHICRINIFFMSTYLDLRLSQNVLSIQMRLSAILCNCIEQIPERKWLRAEQYIMLIYAKKEAIYTL